MKCSWFHSVGPQAACVAGESSEHRDQVQDDEEEEDEDRDDDGR